MSSSTLLLKLFLLLKIEKVKINLSILPTEKKDSLLLEHLKDAIQSNVMKPTIIHYRSLFGKNGRVKKITKTMLNLDTKTVLLIS